MQFSIKAIKNTSIRFSENCRKRRRLNGFSVGLYLTSAQTSKWFEISAQIIKTESWLSNEPLA